MIFLPRLRAAMPLIVLTVAVPPAAGQVKYPAPPEKFDIQIRYRITAARAERVRQFRVMEKFLKDQGFAKLKKVDDDLDILDSTAERFEGTIPSKSVLPLADRPEHIPLLADPRIKTVLFKRTDYQLPADAAARVSLRIRIATGFFALEQQKFHGQVVAQLAKMGFREAIGYDHDRYSLVRGDLPTGNLSRLLKDLRTEPAGWLIPDEMPRNLPSPLKDVLPIRTIEVLSNADLSFLAAPRTPLNRLPFTPDLRLILDDKEQALKPVRAEVVMDHKLTGGDVERIRTRLRAQYSREVVNPATQIREALLPTFEGVVGNVATIQFTRASDLERFAGEESVVVIRLPRAAAQTAQPLAANAKATPAKEALASAQAVAFHKLGYAGQGTRIVVVASDFPGLATALGTRFLDKSLRTPVKFIDMTRELSSDLLSAPPGQVATAGTAAARAAHFAAPRAALLLVRVDAAAFHQVYDVARFVLGFDGYTAAMQSRIDQLSFRQDELNRKNALAVEEYRKAFRNFSDEEAPKKRRENAKKVLDLLFQEEGEQAAAISRAVRLQALTRELAGADVVINTLAWESGFELDGLSDLAQMIDSSFASSALAGPRNRSATRPRQTPRPIWVQAASPNRGSIWSGPFLDPQRNGTMEFTASTEKIPGGEWNRELNFIGTRLPDGSRSQTLAAGAKVRLTMQWREAHDPNGYGGHESIFPITLRVFQQLDPEGKARASDELKEIARSSGGPYRVYSEATFGIYEQILEFAAPASGRYCLMVEGGTVYDSRLPALFRHVEVHPRMLVQFLGSAPEKGRPIFASYKPDQPGVAIPGDARAAITVGISGGATGGGPGLELLLKPDLIADGAIDVGADASGSGVAAGFAGGIVAALVGSGAPPADVIGATGLQRGGPARVPDSWLRVVPRK